ncbi:MAG: hypothetical protein J7647_14690 [Cyanobacteria bacterium SBLK]|nr:hypothetical protein [Cyanobacteria bacterium SBLK]
MFSKMRRLCSRFLNKSRNVQNEPINKVTLIVIIVIDIFILFNVFSGLDNISHWYLNPAAAHPCYFEWSDYRDSETPDKDWQIIRDSLQQDIKFRENFQRAEKGHLGSVSATCLNYGNLKDEVNRLENQKISTDIDRRQTNINNLEERNRRIREQYDSTLLEKIAGQPRDRSINDVDSDKVKQELEKNNHNIAAFKEEITTLKNELLSQSEIINFITFLDENEEFATLETSYKRASFWYPSIQITFQAIFLLPLLVLALSLHNFSEKKGYGLMALMSWHLLVIFLIPLLIKIFQFLQFGGFFQFLFKFISKLLGGLLFLINYLYIFIIPALGFGIIKFFQKIVFNPKIQAANRVQQSRCIKCAKKLQPHDSHCPHCGYYQYTECPNCHNLTYKKLSYCKECGASQRPNR